MGKTGSALDKGMMGELRDLSNKAAEKVATGADKFYDGVTQTAEAAVNKTKQAAKDAEKVKDDFKKVNLRRPLD